MVHLATPHMSAALLAARCGWLARRGRHRCAQRRRRCGLHARGRWWWLQLLAAATGSTAHPARRRDEEGLRRAYSGPQLALLLLLAAAPALGHILFTSRWYSRTSKSHVLYEDLSLCTLARSKKTSSVTVGSASCWPVRLLAAVTPLNIS
jgi:hypothetical protein